MPRLDRKDDHIYLSLRRAPGRAAFSDIHFIHNCLPDLDFSTVNIETVYLGRTFRSPLFINAITGGTGLARRINAALAEVARVCRLPMAVGSQMAALEDKAAEESFKIVRCIYPEGNVWANIGSYADPDMVRRAVEMIDADAVQIHLNVPQELAMNGGDRRFSGMVERIKQVVKGVEVPVIVKEVGFGIAGEQAEKIIETGAKGIDIGGKGGTNFMAIERRRTRRKISKNLEGWGIPTAVSLIEVVETARGRANVFAAGGMHSSVDIAKALALGADAVGMAGLPVNLLFKKGTKALIKKIKTIERELRMIMVMTGVSSIAGLREVPLVITGFTAEWMQRRGFDPARFAGRQERKN